MSSIALYLQEIMVAHDNGQNWHFHQPIPKKELSNKDKDEIWAFHSISNLKRCDSSRPSYDTM